jgi:hypothetical protein
LLTREEQELLEAIREAKDPTAAILVAVEIIKDFLSQPLSSKEPEDEIRKESA